MEPRVDYLKNGRGVYEAMRGLEGLWHKADWIRTW